MEQLKPPGHLSMEGNLAENWKEWIQGFDIYLAATGIRGYRNRREGRENTGSYIFALKWAVTEKFRDYLLGSRFIVYTDNNPLSYLQTAKLGATVDAVFDFRKKGYSIMKSIRLASDKVDYYKGKLTINVLKKLIKEGINYYLYLLHYTPIEGKDPIFLNIKDQIRLKECVKSISENRIIKKLLNPDYIFTKPINVNEGTLLLNVKAEYKGKEYILKLKSKLDNFIIDFENNTLYLNDLKTTGHYVSQFSDSFTKFHYSRQMAMYFWMLRLYIKKQL